MGACDAFVLEQGLEDDKRTRVDKGGDRRWGSPRIIRGHDNECAPLDEEELKSKTSKSNG